MEKYSLLLLTIILLSQSISLPNVSDTNGSTDINVYLVDKLTIKVFMVSTELTGVSRSFSLELKYKHTLNFTIHNRTVSGYESVECLGVNMSEGTGTQTTTVSISPGTFLCQNINSSISYTLEELLNRQFSSATELTKSFESFGGVSEEYLRKVTYNYSFRYIGLDRYKGLPVDKFEIKVIANYSNENEESIINGSGIVYLYTGLLYPLYMHFKSDGTYHNETTIVTFKLEASFINIRNNLVSDTRHGVVEQSSLTIIIGGLPGSKIHIRGGKGSDILIATNNGTQYGYIFIVYKGTTYSLADGRTNGDESLFEIYDIAPGEEKKIKLRVKLEEAVELEASPIGLDVMEALILLIPLILLIIIVVPLIWIIHRLLKGGRNREFVETPTLQPSETSTE